MDTSDWIEHRRPDGERVGWMREAGDRFVPVDLLGRDRGGPLDWLDAEELLDELGIGYLADPYLLELPAEPEPEADADAGTGAGADPNDAAAAGQTPAPRALRVRITEVSTERVRVKKDDFGAIDVPLLEYTLDWPAPSALQPWPEGLDPIAPFGPR